MSQVRYATASRPVPDYVYPYHAGIVGGALGGAAMAVVAMLTGLLIGVGPWYPVNLVGATVLRGLQQAPTAELMQFNLPALLIGLVLHLALSTGLGFIFALLLPTCPGPALVWGLLLGPALWAITQYIVLPTINPLMLPSHNPVMSQPLVPASFLIGNLAYSLVLGLWVQRTPKIPVD